MDRTEPPRALIVCSCAVRELSHALRGKGIEVAVVSDIERAVRTTTTERIDCVVILSGKGTPVDRPRLEARLRAVRVPLLPILELPHDATEIARAVLGVLRSGTKGSAAVPPAGPSRTAVGAKTILIVDDDDDLRRALARTLSRLPANVMRASDPVSALEMLEKVEIHLVVSDYALGGGANGLDLLARVRERRPALPRILMTGHDLEADGSLPGDRTAADRIVTKPWSRTELFDACHALLGRAD